MGYNDTKTRVLLGIAFILTCGLPHGVTSTDCMGKAFRCLNSTHFMICVDYGNGVSTAMEDLVIACPTGTECLNTNNFECELPVTTTLKTTSDVLITKPSEKHTTTTELVPDHLSVMDIKTKPDLEEVFAVLPVKPVISAPKENRSEIQLSAKTDVNFVDVVIPSDDNFQNSNMTMSTPEIKTTTATTESYFALFGTESPITEVLEDTKQQVSSTTELNKVYPKERQVASSKSSETIPGDVFNHNNSTADTDNKTSVRDSNTYNGPTIDIQYQNNTTELQDKGNNLTVSLYINQLTNGTQILLERIVPQQLPVESNKLIPSNLNKPIDPNLNELGTSEKHNSVSKKETTSFTDDQVGNDTTANSSISKIVKPSVGLLSLTQNYSIGGLNKSLSLLTTIDNVTLETQQYNTSKVKHQNLRADLDQYTSPINITEDKRSDKTAQNEVFTIESPILNQEHDTLIKTDINKIEQQVKNGDGLASSLIKKDPGKRAKQNITLGDAPTKGSDVILNSSTKLDNVNRKKVSDSLYLHNTTRTEQDQLLTKSISEVVKTNKETILLNESQILTSDLLSSSGNDKEQGPVDITINNSSEASNTMKIKDKVKNNMTDAHSQSNQNIPTTNFQNTNGEITNNNIEITERIAELVPAESKNGSVIFDSDIQGQAVGSASKIQTNLSQTSEDYLHISKPILMTETKTEVSLTTENNPNKDKVSLVNDPLSMKPKDEKNPKEIQIATEQPNANHPSLFLTTENQEASVLNLKSNLSQSYQDISVTTTSQNVDSKITKQSIEITSERIEELIVTKAAKSNNTDSVPPETKNGPVISDSYYQWQAIGSVSKIQTNLSQTSEDYLQISKPTQMTETKTEVSLTTENNPNKDKVSLVNDPLSMKPKDEKNPKEIQIATEQPNANHPSLFLTTENQEVVLNLKSNLSQSYQDIPVTTTSQNVNSKITKQSIEITSDRIAELIMTKAAKSYNTDIVPPEIKNRPVISDSNYQWPAIGSVSKIQTNLSQTSKDYFNPSKSDSNVVTKVEPYNAENVQRIQMTKTKTEVSLTKETNRNKVKVSLVNDPLSMKPKEENITKVLQTATEQLNAYHPSLFLTTQEASVLNSRSNLSQSNQDVPATTTSQNVNSEITKHNIETTSERFAELIVTKVAKSNKTDSVPSETKNGTVISGSHYQWPVISSVSGIQTNDNVSLVNVPLSVKPNDVKIIKGIQTSIEQPNAYHPSLLSTTENKKATVINSLLTDLDTTGQGNHTRIPLLITRDEVRSDQKISIGKSSTVQNEPINRLIEENLLNKTTHQTQTSENEVVIKNNASLSEPADDSSKPLTPYKEQINIQVRGAPDRVQGLLFTKIQKKDQVTGTETLPNLDRIQKKIHEINSSTLQGASAKTDVTNLQQRNQVSQLPYDKSEPTAILDKVPKSVFLVTKANGTSTPEKMHVPTSLTEKAIDVERNTKINNLLTKTNKSQIVQKNEISANTSSKTTQAVQVEFNQTDCQVGVSLGKLNKTEIAQDKLRNDDQLTKQAILRVPTSPLVLDSIKTKKDYSMSNYLSEMVRTPSVILDHKTQAQNSTFKQEITNGSASYDASTTTQNTEPNITIQPPVSVINKNKSLESLPTKNTTSNQHLKINTGLVAEVDKYNNSVHQVPKTNQDLKEMKNETKVPFSELTLTKETKQGNSVVDKSGMVTYKVAAPKSVNKSKSAYVLPDINQEVVLVQDTNEGLANESVSYLIAPSNKIEPQDKIVPSVLYAPNKSSTLIPIILNQVKKTSLNITEIGLENPQSKQLDNLQNDTVLSSNKGQVLASVPTLNDKAINAKKGTESTVIVTTASFKVNKQKIANNNESSSDATQITQVKNYATNENKSIEAMKRNSVNIKDQIKNNTTNEHFSTTTVNPEKPQNNEITVKLLNNVHNDTQIQKKKADDVLKSPSAQIKPNLQPTFQSEVINNTVLKLPTNSLTLVANKANVSTDNKVMNKVHISDVKLSNNLVTIASTKIDPTLYFEINTTRKETEKGLTTNVAHMKSQADATMQANNINEKKKLGVSIHKKDVHQAVKGKERFTNDTTNKLDNQQQSIDHLSVTQISDETLQAKSLISNSNKTENKKKHTFQGKNTQFTLGQSGESKNISGLGKSNNNNNIDDHINLTLKDTVIIQNTTGFGSKQNTQTRIIIGKSSATITEPKMNSAYIHLKISNMKTTDSPHTHTENSQVKLETNIETSSNGQTQLSKKTVQTNDAINHVMKKTTAPFSSIPVLKQETKTKDLFEAKAKAKENKTTKVKDSQQAEDNTSSGHADASIRLSAPTRPATVPSIQENNNVNKTDVKEKASKQRINFEISVQNGDINTRNTKTDKSSILAPKQVSLPGVTNNDDEAESSVNCKSLKPGKYSDKNDCRKFYICTHRRHRPIIGFCPVNTVFSENNKQCTKHVSHCLRNNQFQCTYPGKYRDISLSNVYYICVPNSGGHFLRYTLRCQNGYYLDKSHIVCVRNTTEDNRSRSSSYQESKERDRKRKHRNNRHSSTSRDDEDERDSEKFERDAEKFERDAEKFERDAEKFERNGEKFRCTEEGRFPRPGHCRKYYECKQRKDGFRKRNRKCDGVFHPEKRKCVDEESYECSLD